MQPERLPRAARVVSEPSPFRRLEINSSCQTVSAPISVTVLQAAATFRTEQISIQVQHTHHQRNQYVCRRDQSIVLYDTDREIIPVVLPVLYLSLV